MKKRKGIVLGALVVLCSCGKQEKAIEFPNVKWSMSLQEVKDALDVTEDDILSCEEQKRSISFSVKEQEIFGETAETVHFGFLNIELGEDKNIRQFDEERQDGDEVLCTVTVIYPKDADIEKVQKEMEKEYGKYKLSSMQEFSFYNATGEEKVSISKYEESDTLKLWGNETIEKAIGEKNVEFFKKNWSYYMPNLDKSQWEEFSQNSHLVTVSMAKDEEYLTVNFNAYNLAVYEEIEEKLQE